MNKKSKTTNATELNMDENLITDTLNITVPFKIIFSNIGRSSANNFNDCQIQPQEHMQQHYTKFQCHKICLTFR